MVELYDYKFLLDEHIESGLIKLWKEQDCISIQAARYTCEIAKVVKKVKGKLSLTKNGENYLQTNNRSSLFKLLFLTFTEKFNWSFNDGFPEEPVAQYGYLFSIYLLLEYGHSEKKADFYADKYLTISHNFLPLFSESYTSVEKQFYDCYQIRTFENLQIGLGLQNFNRKEYF